MGQVQMFFIEKLLRIHWFRHNVGS